MGDRDRGRCIRSWSSTARDNLRQALEQLLVSNGYAFCGARDAESGLELLASEHPDLLLLDVMLPG